MMWTDVRNIVLDMTHTETLLGLLCLMCHQALSSGIPADSFDLRSPLILNMRNGMLWGYQTLLRNWVVIKVAFGCIVKHDWDVSGSRWDLPLLHNGRDCLWAPRGGRILNAWPCYVING